MLKKNWRYLLPVLAFCIFYLIWLSRTYYDVAYEDEIQLLAGNLNHMLDHNVSIQDFYYRSPFLLFFSNILVFLNCKLLGFNTYYENVVSALALACVGVYYVRSQVSLFNERNRGLFSILTALIIFSLAKWELSIWGGGFSHYIVVFFGFICVDIAHRYYLLRSAGGRVARFAIALFILLSIVSILEATSYFLPFLLSILTLLLINYRVFRTEIDIKKWKNILATTLGLIVFALLINYAAESYSAHHPYEGYGKVSLSGSIGSSFKKVVTDPLWVIKFYLISHTGNLIDKDYYPTTSFVKSILPWLGLVVLCLYGYAVYHFVKKKKIEGLFSISLILYTIIFYGTVLIGRMNFGDLYYGGSSRYSAATFAGLLGLATFSMLYLNQDNGQPGRRKFYYFALLLITLGTVITDINEWHMGPYRQESFRKLEYNMKMDKDLETLVGYSVGITEQARRVEIRNKLNVFKPKVKLESFTINSDLTGYDTLGFYGQETSSGVPFRWTNGKVMFLLPNLFTTKDTVRVRLNCYSPYGDTPRIVLNDDITPFRSEKTGEGYEYRFAFREQTVFFRLSIENESHIPHESNKDSPDMRVLGLMFKSISLYN